MISDPDVAALSRRAFLRRAGVVGAVAVTASAGGGFLSACSSTRATTATAASSGGASTTTAGASAVGSASAAGGGGGQPQTSLFCGPDCAAALKLNADPASIHGKVGLSLNSEGFTYGVAMQKEGLDEAKKYFPNIQLTVTDGQGSVQKQSSDVDDLVARGIDVLLISPYEADALVPAIQRAQQKGVKVITVDRNANTKVISYISSDDYKNGQAVGQYLVSRLKGSGRVIEITGTPGSSPATARGGGFHQAIGGSSGIKVVASANGDFLQATGQKVMESLLQRYPKGSFDAIYAHSDDMAAGVVQAMTQANRINDGVFMVSVNGEKIGMQLIQAQRVLAATAAYAVVAREGVIAAAKVLANESIPARVDVNGPVITKDNVAQYIDKIDW